MSSQLSQWKQKFISIHGTACLFVILLAIWSPANLSAQIGVESLLGNVTDISLYGSCWRTKSEILRSDQCPADRLGFGVEVLWGLKPYKFGPKPDSVVNWKVTGKTETLKGGKLESTFTYSPEVTFSPDDRLTMIAELGLGYGQFSGLESTDTTFELKGTVREAPALALYLSFENGPIPALEVRRFSVEFSPYLGIRSGLIQLQNAQLLAPDSIGSGTVSVYTGAAQAFQLGGALGLAIQLGRVNLLGEYAYNLRRLTSVQWTAPGLVKMPEEFPRELDFTGSTFSFGFQIPLRDPTK